MQLTAKNVEVHDFTGSWCSPLHAVCLIVALGLSWAQYRKEIILRSNSPRGFYPFQPQDSPKGQVARVSGELPPCMTRGSSWAQYRHLLSFASAKQQAYFNATGICVPNSVPGRRTVEDTWKCLTSLWALESPTWYNNTVSISWPLKEWLEYVQSQDAIWNTVADPQDGITLIIRGDDYPVAGCSWMLLNVSIMEHGCHARTTSHMWVISLAYARDKDVEDLKIL